MTMTRTRFTQTITLSIGAALSVLALSVARPTLALADEGLHSNASHVSTGFHVGEIDDDFALGVELTSPYLVSSRLALRVSGSMAFVEGIAAGDTMTSTMRYQSLRIGLIGVGGMLSRAIRVYGEGGVVALFPSAELSEDNAIGGYGKFGFEFFMSTEHSTPVSYFIELGSQGIAARAEKLEGQPLFGNGLSASAGLRLHL